MSDLKTYETLDTPEITENRPKRTFLIVLSVFTFTSSALRLFLAAVIFMFLARRSYFPDDYNSREKWTMIFAYAITISSLLNGLGVLMMLLRKRTSFLIYFSGFIVSLFSIAAFVFSAHPSVYKEFFYLAIVLTALLLIITTLILYIYAIRKPNQYHGNT